MADEAFSLKDAIALYSGKIDLSHKLWAYLQVVALAVMGFAWSARPWCCGFSLGHLSYSPS